VGWSRWSHKLSVRRNISTKAWSDADREANVQRSSTGCPNEFEKVLQSQTFWRQCPGQSWPLDITILTTQNVRCSFVLVRVSFCHWRAFCLLNKPRPRTHRTSQDTYIVRKQTNEIFVKPLRTIWNTGGWRLCLPVSQLVIPWISELNLVVILNPIHTLPPRVCKIKLPLWSCCQGLFR
jgi:hypothetical protein